MFREPLIFDKVNSYVTTISGTPVLPTNNFRIDENYCSDKVVNNVIDMYNNGCNLSQIDDYLLDESDCTQDAREQIVERLYHLYPKN